MEKIGIAQITHFNHLPVASDGLKRLHFSRQGARYLGGPMVPC
jgi:hypothetical protein